MNEVAVRRTRRSREMRRRARRRKRILTLVTAAVVVLLAIFALSAGTGTKADEPGGDAIRHTGSTETFAMPLVYTMERLDDEKTDDLLITKQQDRDEPKPTKTPEPVVQLPYTEADVEALCKAVYGEALITQSDKEMAAVVWCVLNRMDSSQYDYDSIYEAVTAPYQFHGYDPDNPVTEHIEWLVLDVLSRWMEEKAGAENVGRTLPAGYLFFWGDGWHNHYTTEYHGDDYWDWRLPNPYET